MLWISSILLWDRENIGVVFTKLDTSTYLQYLGLHTSSKPTRAPLDIALLDIQTQVWASWLAIPIYVQP